MKDKVLCWIGYAMAAMLLLNILLWTVSRSRGPTAEQEQALALMEESWQPQGRNAFAAIWLLQYDVPQAEQAAIVAEDSQQLATMLQAVFAEAETAPVFESAAKGRYEDLSPGTDDWAMFCRIGRTGCYNKVAANFDAYLALVKRNEVLLSRAAELSNYDYYKNELPAHPSTPVPRLQLGKLRLTQHAVQFATGDRDGALDGICRDIITWRRFGANSDSLITHTAGIVYSTYGYGQLLAELLESMPPDTTLPQSCAKALAPMAPQELSLCRPLQREFHLWSSVVASAVVMAGAVKDRHPGVSSLLNRARWTFAYDERMTRAAMATKSASSCLAPALQQIAGDIAPSPHSASLVTWLQCKGNRGGCNLSNMIQPSYINYERRAQDQGARVQLLATLLWLRESADDESEMPLTQRLDLRPAELRSPTRDIEVTEDGKAIRIRQFDTTRGEYWQVPLPKHFRPDERS